ncbi:MAG: ATP synthase F1 subunit gamma [Deltaproteobacteria bacterium]|nr:ATP synthase F1 subunit gamma [Deltaproteobacteria bacterium]
MATLKSIRKRINATKNTKKLTRAMRMIAAVKLRRAQMKAIEARVFSNEIMRLLTETIKRGTAVKNPLLEERSERSGSTDIIIFTSDRGMCGTFNENLLSHVSHFIEEKKEKGISINCCVIGRKGRDYFKKTGTKIEKAYVHITEPEFKKIAETEMPFFKERFLNGLVDEVLIAFNKFKGVGSSEPKLERLFPASPPVVVEEYAVNYIYEPTKENVIDWLISQSIASHFNQAYLESAAGEISARMVAMDKATRNAEDLITGLTTQFNKARQSSITKELIDIVGGAEALK